MLVLAVPLPFALLSLLVHLASQPLADARATPKSSPEQGASIPMVRRTDPRRFGTLEERGAWARRNRLRTEAKYSKRGQLESRGSGMNL